MTGRRGDAGSGAVLAVSVIAGIVAVALGLATMGSAFALRQHAVGAADLAALAAADTAAGILPGFPCDNAARVARANQVVLASCEPDGLVVTVEVQATFGGIPMVARSRAGPPGA